MTTFVKENVALKGYQNVYPTQAATSGSALTVDTKVGFDQEWKFEMVTDGVYTFKSNNGMYLRADYTNKQAIAVYASASTTADRWTFSVANPDGRLCIKSAGSSVAYYLAITNDPYSNNKLLLSTTCTYSYHFWYVKKRSNNQWLDQITGLKVAFKTSHDTWLRAPADQSATAGMNQQKY